MGRNSKKEILESKCKKCSGEVYVNERSLTCTSCRNIFHNDCIQMDRITYEKIKKLPVWFCCDICKKNYDEKKSVACDMPDQPTNRDLMNAIQSLKTSQNFLSDKYDDMSSQLENVLQSFKSLEQRILVLEQEKHTLKKEISYNHYKNEIKEQEVLDNNIVVSGISNEVNVSPDIIVKIGKTLDVNLNISTEDIVSVKRLFVQNENVPAEKQVKKIPVIVILKNRDIKKQLYKAQKDKKDTFTAECGLQGENGKLFIRDQLTSFNFKLIRAARKYKYDDKIKYAWVQDSKVLVRKNDDSKIVRIKTLEELHAFVNEG